jgi:hypothetical protein
MLMAGLPTAHEDKSEKHGSEDPPLQLRRSELRHYKEAE